MALKFIRSILAVSLIGLLFTTLVFVDDVQALNQPAANLPLLATFVSQVKDGHASELRGVYIPEILAAAVVQQPKGKNEFVSPRHNIVTQFNLAAQFGSTGLLAHNYLAGESFSLLEKDKTFYLVYGDGQISIFIVTEILRYQALEPTSPSSNFVDLADNSLLTTSELFSKVYAQPGNVILQTCISKDDNPSWGRLFVIAKPYSTKP